MAKRRDEGPAKIVAPNYEETTIAQKPDVAEDNVERRRFDRNSKKQRESDGKRMIQRLNEENGRQENTVPSTWRWCKQGSPCLSQTTDCWPRPRSLLLTVLNKYLFNPILNNNAFTAVKRDAKF